MTGKAKVKVKAKVKKPARRNRAARVFKEPLPPATGKLFFDWDARQMRLYDVRTGLQVNCWELRKGHTRAEAERIARAEAALFIAHSGLVLS